MMIVQTWLRHLTDGFRAFREALAAQPNPRFKEIAASVAIVFVVVAAAWRFAPAGLIGAVDSLSSAPEFAQDDGAGDASTSSGNAGRYLPIPATLEDERVLAAVGPIANLACRKADYANQSATNAAPAVSDLGPPLADKSATAWLDRSETGSRGGAPGMSGPLSSPQFDVDDLLTRNLLAAGLSPIAALPTPDAANCPALLRHTFNKLQTGQPQSLCQFQGKVLLIVNTASYCAYTQQYEGLEAMYSKYRDRGMVVVGFPSNDFGKQEPGSNQQIAEFCRTTYGVQFPMFEKTSVTKLTANPLYVELAAKTGAAPKWNFHKYVVDRNGTPIASFASDVTPDSPQLVELIERLLAEKYAAKD